MQTKSLWNLNRPNSAKWMKNLLSELSSTTPFLSSKRNSPKGVFKECVQHRCGSCSLSPTVNSLYPYSWTSCRQETFQAAISSYRYTISSLSLMLQRSRWSIRVRDWCPDQHSSHFLLFFLLIVSEFLLERTVCSKLFRLALNACSFYLLSIAVLLLTCFLLYFFNRLFLSAGHVKYILQPPKTTSLILEPRMAFHLLRICS